jgi:hypothetical protein
MRPARPASQDLARREKEPRLTLDLRFNLLHYSGPTAPRSISSVDSDAHTSYLGIWLLACQDGSRWLASFVLVAQRCTAKIGLSRHGLA